MKSKEFIEQIKELDPDGELEIFFHFSKGAQYFDFIVGDVITYDSNTPGVKEIIVLLEEPREPDEEDHTDNADRQD